MIVKRSIILSEIHTFGSGVALVVMLAWSRSVCGGRADDQGWILQCSKKEAKGSQVSGVARPRSAPANFQTLFQLIKFQRNHTIDIDRVTSVWMHIDIWGNGRRGPWCIESRSFVKLLTQFGVWYRVQTHSLPHFTPHYNFWLGDRSWIDCTLTYYSIVYIYSYLPYRYTYLYTTSNTWRRILTLDSN